jgi:hypothetical protein
LQRKGSWGHGQVRARPCHRFPHSRRRTDPNRPRKLAAPRMGAPSAGRCPRPRRRPGSACTSARCGGICPVGCWPTIGFRAATTASRKSRSRASGSRTKAARPHVGRTVANAKQVPASRQSHRLTLTPTRSRSPRRRLGETNSMPSYDLSPTTLAALRARHSVRRPLPRPISSDEGSR